MPRYRHHLVKRFARRKVGLTLIALAKPSTMPPPAACSGAARAADLSRAAVVPDD
jgi:hypothetical protein